MNLLPAILLGGPPHCGKSVLTYSLSAALRQRGVPHYALRAAPDSEGDWANDADQATVRAVRVKGAFSTGFVDFVCRSLDRRHLPLLVDVGGRPTPDQERIFDGCTHAVLLHRDDAELAEWQARVERHNLIPIAVLRSSLDDPDSLADPGPVLRGVLHGLQRGRAAAGPAFDALLDRLAGLFDYSPQELLHLHRLRAPLGEVRVLAELASLLGIAGNGNGVRWAPQHLAALLDFLPAREPLAVYGRGPAWLYAALAAHASPAAFWLFDVRLGWVSPPTLHFGSPPPDAPLQVQTLASTSHVRLEFRMPRAYLDYDESGDLRLPQPPLESGVVLSGQLPIWLWAGLAQACARAVWVAIYAPQLNGAVVVVRNAAGAPALGMVL